MQSQHFQVTNTAEAMDMEYMNSNQRQQNRDANDETVLEVINM